MTEQRGHVVGSLAPDVLLHDDHTSTDVALSSFLDGSHTVVLYWFCALRCENEYCRNCHARAPSVLAAVRKAAQAEITGTTLCFVRIMGERADASSFASALGTAATDASWLSSFDPQPEYGVDRLPHVTVIHRSGLVVRNGDAADLDSLLLAMAAEPPEDQILEAPPAAGAPALRASMPTQGRSVSRSETRIKIGSVQQKSAAEGRRASVGGSCCVQ